MSPAGSADTSMESMESMEPMEPMEPRESMESMEEQPPTRPVDVDTAFGLWLTALGFLLIGQVVDTALAPNVPGGPVGYAVTGVFLVLVCAVVVTFLLLLR